MTVIHDSSHSSYAWKFNYFGDEVQIDVLLFVTDDVCIWQKL